MLRWCVGERVGLPLLAGDVGAIGRLSCIDKGIILDLKGTDCLPFLEHVAAVSCVCGVQNRSLGGASLVRPPVLWICCPV